MNEGNLKSALAVVALVIFLAVLAVI